jgi:uncharacterized membrane protein
MGMGRKVALKILALLFVVAIAQAAFYFGQLPDRVATHFDVKGNPDGWSGRRAATLMMLGFQCGMPLFILAMGKLASRMPESMLNIPDKAYWMHPDRKADALQVSANYLAWIAVLVAVFITVLNHLTFFANRDSAPLRLGWFAAAMTLFLLAVLALSIRMVLHFKIRPRR